MNAWSSPGTSSFLTESLRMACPSSLRAAQDLASRRPRHFSGSEDVGHGAYTTCARIMFPTRVEGRDLRAAEELGNVLTPRCRWNPTIPTNPKLGLDPYNPDP